MSRVRIDSSACVGHGQCAMMAPEVFDLDAEGYAQLLVDGDLDDQGEVDSRNAASACPEQAIVVE
ncbi:ferredoxin [Nocardioides sp. BGMRC 2183]|nr:ferredoxin [Nocardioides sp. BGMRC 2183]